MAIDSSRFTAFGGHWLVRASVVVVLAATIGPASGAAREPTGLSITGDVARPITWTLAELEAMPRTTVTVQESGQPVVYEGVLAGELLGRAGVPVGRDLTGGALTTYVKAIAADGYEVVFSIGELDPALSADEIIIADTVGGKPLSSAQGPLRIVAPHDKRMARSVRMLVRLEVVRLKKMAVQAAPDFSGTWKIDAARGSSVGGGRGGGRGTGGGLGLGPSPDDLTIRREATSLLVDERRGNETTHLVYGLDGRPVTNMLGAGRGAGAPAVFVSRWKDQRLITTITAPPAPGSDTKTRYEEVRYLDREGLLVVETTIPGQQNSRTVVYRKQAE